MHFSPLLLCGISSCAGKHGMSPVPPGRTGYKDLNFFGKDKFFTNFFFQAASVGRAATTKQILPLFHGSFTLMYKHNYINFINVNYYSALLSIACMGP
uniref:Secreted protein n=1 Tax=Pyxicephalus adspersus TaxID=30357 RepID=A0AAV3AXD8_PYXAD|nr:TPA: hypothetical protein GDO54_000269 [Pyxicephalus adspersus]